MAVEARRTQLSPCRFLDSCELFKSLGLPPASRMEQSACQFRFSGKRIHKCSKIHSFLSRATKLGNAGKSGSNGKPFPSKRKLFLIVVELSFPNLLLRRPFPARANGFTPKAESPRSLPSAFRPRTLRPEEPLVDPEPSSDRRPCLQLVGNDPPAVAAALPGVAARVPDRPPAQRKGIAAAKLDHGDRAIRGLFDVQ